MTIAPFGYKIFWADEDGVDGPDHCNFKLSADGETLILLTPNLAIMDSITFGVQTTDKGFARVPNGTGNFVIQNPTFNASNNTTALSETDIKPVGFSLSPNPAQASVMVKANQQPDGQPITVHDMTGRIVTRIFPQQMETVLSVEHWPAGVYTVSYGTGVSRLVVSH